MARIRYALAVLTLLAASATARPAPTVATSEGPVTGMAGAEPGFAVFRGIPYAAPPVGVLRWRPPVLPAKRVGGFAADHPGADCYGVRALPDAAPASEDCLTLNIFTPSLRPTAKLPVMVWIYGGAFNNGTANVPRYDGTGLNRKGVILVSFNYRTGVLGFLAHPALAAEGRGEGDYGVLDAIAALRWVKANIAGFGGDPANVTVFGQSSGSQTVHLLTISPLAKGLMAKVIGESGAGFGIREPFARTDAERTGTDYAAAFGNSLAAMRAATPQALIAAVQGRKFEPMVDGWVVPLDPHATYRRRAANDLPTLVGNNGEEGRLSTTLTLTDWIASVRQRYRGQADRVLALYPASTDEEARAAEKATGMLMAADYNIASWADGQARTGRAPVYQYRFIHAPPPQPSPFGGPPSTGAFHGAEIPYVFNNLANDQRPWTQADRVIEDEVTSYWTNFAKTGDPNGRDAAGRLLPRWDRVDPADPRVLVIGDTVAMAPRPDAAKLAAIEAVFYGPGGIQTEAGK